MLGEVEEYLFPEKGPWERSDGTPSLSIQEWESPFVEEAGLICGTPRRPY
jgi:hypothetical protein